MTEMSIPESELILHQDGSVYHLHLKDEHIADTVLLAGDQGRVAQISRHFDEITFQVQNREFFTHTGWYKGKRITALSTGIGTDNIHSVE
jgi:uridine phosphorylase